MIVIDIGNTNTVLAIYNNKKIFKKTRINTDHLKSSKFNIENIFKHHKKKRYKINICVISSVVPNLNFFIKSLALKYNFDFYNLNAKNIPFKIKIKYEINKIGADRLANAISVIEHKFKNCIKVIS